MSKVTQENYVTKIIQYESGELYPNDVIRLFSFLRKNGILANLQGHYHRGFSRLLGDGYLDYDGNILALVDEEPERGFVGGAEVDEPEHGLTFTTRWAHDVPITLRSNVVLVDSNWQRHEADLHWVADFLEKRTSPTYTILHAEEDGVHYLKQDVRL